MSSGTDIEDMKNLHWLKVLLCGFVAGVIWNLLGTACLGVFAPDFMPAVQRLAPGRALDGSFFFAIDVAMGVWAVWLYSAIAPRYKTRSTAVVTAAAAWWTLKTLQSAKWAGLGFIELSPALVFLGVATAIGAGVALTAGAWLYDRVDDAAYAPHVA